MATETHTNLLTAAARQVLRPFGLRQKGRSRTWIDDRGWWVGVVEFQPSSWSKGSYLNVGGMWLWREGDHHVRFDVGHRVAGLGFVEYANDDQFEPEARRLAGIARDEVQGLRELLVDLDAAVSWLSDHNPTGQGWPAYHLGVALGLAGQPAESGRCLRALAVSPDSPAWWVETVSRAHDLADLVEQDVDAFQARMRDAITASRAALKLPEDLNLSFGRAM